MFLTVNFKAREDREFAEVSFSCIPTLAPAKQVETGILIGQDGRGKVVAAEYKKILPGQMGMDDFQKTDQAPNNVVSMNK